MNGPKNRSNRKAIEKYGQIEVMAEIDLIDDINPQKISEIFKHKF
jgi:malonyl-CoA O-methyltransferase